jgi:hypothetical protein
VETFDAFYARTVWNVTSQMHALADGDGAADHAIREAYARAYQQWYEISVFPDTEGWVLRAAQDAYQRRRPDAMIVPRQPGAETPSDAGGGQAGGSRGDEDDQRSDSTWPGIYRPRAAAVAAPQADPDATVAPPAAPGRSARPGRFSFGDRRPATEAASQQAAGFPAQGIPPQGSPASAAQTQGMTPAPAGQPASAWPAGGPGLAGTPGTGNPAARPWYADRRKVVAGAAVLAVLVAGVAYAALGGSTPSPKAGKTSPKVTGKPVAQMLPAGRTGRASAIPWPLVGPGWTLAETSSVAPDQDGGGTGSGTFSIYVVDPEGGKYSVTSTSGAAGTEPQLLAWSGDGKNALYATGSQTSPGYSILNVQTGQLASLSLPAGVSAVGFLQGAYQATLASLPRRAGQPSWTCLSACGALSSPNGDTAVWGITGDEMEVVSNAGGHARKLPVPGSGTPSSCIPLSWWTDTEVLAQCAAGPAAGSSELWLVPTTGGAPTALTAASGSESGSGGIEGAWQLGSSTYVNITSGTQCSGAASGPGGVNVLSLSQNQSTSPVTIPDSTGNHNSIVSAGNGRLVVLAQTSCPGTSSLLSFNPSGSRTQVLLAGQSGQVGVIGAVPYGNGPMAVSAAGD